jgi:hypothetical protein
MLLLDVTPMLALRSCSPRSTHFVLRVQLKLLYMDIIV